MPIAVSCLCGQAFQANESLAGKRARCPKCGNVIVIPHQAPPAAQPAGFQHAYPAQAPPGSPPGFGTAAPISEPAFSNPSPMMGQPAFAATPAGWPTQQGFPHRRKGMSRGLLIGLIAGGAALLVAAVVTVVLVLVLSRDDTEAVSESNSESESTPFFVQPSASSRSTGKANQSNSSVAASDSQYDANLQRQEKLMNEMLSEFEALISTLDSVRDRNSAAAAAPKLDRIRARVPQLLEQVKAMPSLKPADEMRLKQQADSRMRAFSTRVVVATQRAAMKSENEPRFIAALQRLGDEWKRLDQF